MKTYTIQYLRAVAALLVLTFHAFVGNNNFLDYLDESIESIAFFGHYGVDMFFVISGAIMALIVKDSDCVKTFIKKRMARIYPTYFQATILAMLAWLIFRRIFDLRVYPHGSWGLFLSLLPFEFQGVSNMILPQAWTLFYEICFIFALPLLYRFRT